MTNSLLDSLLGSFRSQGLGELASRLGQPEASVARGFETTVASMLGALGNKTGDTGAMRQIFDLASSAPHDDGTLNNISGLLGGGSAASSGLASLGGRFLTLLFGSQESKAADLIGQSSGLSSSAVSTLMKVGAPLLLGFLSRRIHQDRLDATSFSSLVGRESAAARSVLPAGFASFFGASAAPKVVVTERATAKVSPVAVETYKESSSNRWVLPVLAGLLLLAGLWWFLGRNRTHEVAQTTQAVAEDIGTRARTTADLVQQTLTSGVSLSYPKGGLEDRLVSYLKVSAGSAATEWFEFDRLLFDTNSATLQPSSQEQLKNVAEILKAYPKTKVKIGGYTDNTGDPAANKKLSDQRAANVMNELIGMGISADRLRSEGFGQENAIADNSTEEGRQKNRRIALRVTES